MMCSAQLNNLFVTSKRCDRLKKNNYNKNHNLTHSQVWGDKDGTSVRRLHITASFSRRETLFSSAALAERRQEFVSRWVCEFPPRENSNARVASPQRKKYHPVAQEDQTSHTSSE